MAELFVLPGGSGTGEVEKISVKDARFLVAIHDNILRLELILQEHEALLRSRINHGARIEPGAARMLKRCGLLKQA
jgi:hypothetical protein